MAEHKASTRIIAGLGAAGILAQAGWVTLNFSSLPVWIHYGLHRSEYLGLVVAAFMISEAAFRPLFGILSDIIGRKPVLIVGPVIAVVSTALMLLVPNVFWMILFSTIDGIGLAAYWPAAYALVADSVDDDHRSTAMSVLNGSMMAGVAVGWFLGGLTNDLTHSLTGSFYFVGLMFVLAAVVGLLLFPGGRNPQASSSGSQRKTLLQNFSWAEMYRPFRLVPDMLVLNVIMFIAIGLLMPIMKLYAMRQYGLSETAFGLVVGPAAVFLGFAAVVAGRVADRWGHMKAVSYGCLLTAIGMWPIPLFHNLWISTAASLFIGIGFVLAYPAWMSIAADVESGEERGRLIGAVGMAEGVGAIIGVMLGPLLYKSGWASIRALHLVHYDVPFYLSAIMLSIATVVAFTWVRARRTKVA